MSFLVIQMTARWFRVAAERSWGRLRGGGAAGGAESQGWQGQRGAGGRVAGCGSAGRSCRRCGANTSGSLVAFPARTSLCYSVKFQPEKMHFLSFFPLFFSAVAVSRAQVQQEPSAQTSEGTGINITCSHPNIGNTGYQEYIHWYRQLPGRGPTFLVSAFKGSKEIPDQAGRLSVSEDHRSSALWLARPRFADAAMYYCVLVARGVEPGLRPGTNRFGRDGSTVPSGPAGGAAFRATKLHPD
ncbi:uncharacterized protein LOC107324948 [Coturnix japonica]|uniref:uncharacterized protein LOC107324948 n=1 Tax=Coturnix japonica TaxID=93934 RepID=UPI0007780438|nr:uncharacterized protein LOC107324948 [Coturnix japonica]